MPRSSGWFWTAERLEELIGVMKKDSDSFDAETGVYTFRGSKGLPTRLVAPYDKVDESVDYRRIGMGVQCLQHLGMLEAGRHGQLPHDYERKFTPRSVTNEMIVRLKAWKAEQRG